MRCLNRICKTIPFFIQKFTLKWCMAVVVAQLTAQLLPIPEDPGSNPVIGNFYWTYLLLTVCRKDENKEKETGNCPFKKLCMAIKNCQYCCGWNIDCVDSHQQKFYNLGHNLEVNTKYCNMQPEKPNLFCNDMYLWDNLGQFKLFLPFSFVFLNSDVNEIRSGVMWAETNIWPLNRTVANLINILWS